MNKQEKLIIVGGSGAGKDFLLKKVVESGLKGCVKLTTRPKRLNEIDGVEYKFISNEEFFQLKESKEFITHQEFSVTPFDRDPEKWYYGITLEEFNNSQAFILTPGEVKTIDPEIRKKCFIVYLDIDRKIRESRILNRKDLNDSIKRRLDSDEIDFRGFNDYDLKITDPDFDAESVLDLMY